MDEAKFKRLAQRVRPGSTLLRAWPLTGGVSAHVTAVEVRLPDGSTEKWVVRQHGARDLAQNPDMAEDEFRLLSILKEAGVPAPEPHYVDAAGEILGSPCFVVGFIEGEGRPPLDDLHGVVTQMASQLVRIHVISPARFDLSFLPRQSDIYAKKLGERPAVLDESLDEGRIRDVLASVWPLARWNEDVLLHGDYWPGNTLWKDGKLVGLIDWEDARVGDPLEDFANTRLEMLWELGVDAMHSFTQVYRSSARVDFTDLRYWDLCAALRPAFKIGEWAGDAARERVMRERHRWFVEQALT
ncbi:MAG TPA: phosphotransferase [Chloroflexia bacterium]|nr:phosphotransferase [Chloroflexia bacterium]